MSSLMTEHPRLSTRRETSKLRTASSSLELERTDPASEEAQVRLKRIEVSDGTVGWDVIRASDGRLLGDIIRIARVKPGGQPRFSYYGRKASRYFGHEFRSKSQALEYIASRG